MQIALTIAGSDSGGGAGLQADLKTFHQFGVFGTSVVTAVTAQNTRGIAAWEAVSASLVARQIEVLAVDLFPQATKSGMLADGEVLEAVAWGLTRFSLPSYVLDPVLVATSGERLLERDAEGLVARRLVPLAEIVTPNVPEAEILVEDEIRSTEAMARAARALVRQGARAALVTGGHLPGEEVVDVLATADHERRYAHPRLERSSTHGTGCTLSAGIAAGLARGWELEGAVALAIDFVHRAIAEAPGLGHGAGPLNHFVPVPKSPPARG